MGVVLLGGFVVVSAAAVIMLIVCAGIVITELWNDSAPDRLS